MYENNLSTVSMHRYLHSTLAVFFNWQGQLSLSTIGGGEVPWLLGRMDAPVNWAIYCDYSRCHETPKNFWLLSDICQQLCQFL